MAMTAQQSAMVVMPHPILAAVGREVITELFQGGETIADYLDRNGIALDYPCLLTLDGAPVPPGRWGEVCPRPGQLIEVRAVPQGGGGSDMQRAVLSIVVLAAAAYGQFYVGSALGSAFAGTVAAGGIVFAGMSLVNQIAPLPSSNLSASQGLGDSSSTYALSGSSNRARPYEPLPLLYGVHRVWPDQAAQPFTEFDGDEQYLYLALNFGLGRIELDPSTFKIGDTALEEFEGVEIYTAGDDGVIPNFPGNVDTITGDDLTAAAGWISRTSSIDTNGLGVDLSGQLFYAGENGITRRSAEFEIQYRRIDGPVTSLHSWQTYGQTVSYTHYWSKGHWAHGGWTQVGYTEEPSDAHTDGASAGEYVKDDHPVIGTMTHELFWRWRPYSELTSWTDAQGRIYYDEPCPPSTREETAVVIYNDNREAVRRSYRISRLPVGQYEVQVRRVTPDETSEYAVSDFTWSALRSYQVDDADYSGQTRLGLRILASSQLNGQMDQFNVRVSRYVQAWNGSDWVWQVSSNPAWIFLDFARGGEDANGRRRFGAGIPFSQIDLDLIKAWATFCDTNSLTFNAVFDRAMTAGEALDAIAACGRATRSMGTGRLGVVWEEQNAPTVAVYGMANIKAGSFSVEYISQELAEEVEVSFINAATDYEPDTVRALAPGVTNPVSTAKVDLFGCTSEDMAGRFANLVIARNVYMRRRISWECDAEGLAVQKGEVVTLSHDLTQWGYSGRLVSGTTTALLLDKPVPFDVGGSHYITIRQPNGTMTTHAVDYQVGENDAITLTTDPLPVSPDADRPIDFIWLFAPQATPGKRVKVSEIRPVDENSVRIVATDDDPGYYAAEGGSYSYSPPATLLRTPSVSNLQVSETVINYADNVVKAHISWKLENTERARLRIGVNGGNLRDYGEVLGGQYDYSGRFGEQLVIEVSPVAIASVGVDTTQVLNYTLGSYTQSTLPALPTPADVWGLELSGIGSAEGQGAGSEYIGKDIKLQWWDGAVTATEFGSDPVNGDAGGRDPNFDCYVVRVYHGGTLVRTAYPRDPAYIYPHEFNAEDGNGAARRDPLFEVTQRNIDGVESKTQARLQPNNAAPTFDVAPTFTPGFGVIGVSFPRPDDLDYEGFKVWMGTATGFTRNDTTLVYDGPGTKATIEGLAPGTTYYFRLVLRDAFGDGAESLEFSAATPATIDASSVAGLGNWATRLTPADIDFINANLGADSLPSTRIQSVVAGKIAAGTMTTRVAIGGVFVATATEAVMNETGLTAGTWRLDMGPVTDGGTTYLVRFHDGNGTSKFHIDQYGNASLNGTITANAGAIGGWTLSASQLYASNMWINAASQYLAIGSATFGNQGIQLQYNGGTPRAYVGDGLDRYMKFDGTNLVLGPKTKLAGAGGYDDDDLYIYDTGDTIPDAALTADPGTAQITRLPGEVLLAADPGEAGSVRRDLWDRAWLSDFSFAKNLKIKARPYLGVSAALSNNVTGYLLCGYTYSDSGPALGWKFLYKTKGSVTVYAVCKDNSGTTTETLIGTFDWNTAKKIEVEFTAGSKAVFTVGSSTVTVTTGLPSGAPFSLGYGALWNFYLNNPVANSSAAQMGVGEIKMINGLNV